MSLLKDLKALDAALTQAASRDGSDPGLSVERIYASVSQLAQGAAGLEELAARGPRFGAAGLFEGGPWKDPSLLLPTLVTGGLLADDKTAALEIMSELRMLAIAEGKVKAELSAELATEFLGKVVCRNLMLLTPTGSEEERTRPATYAKARELLRFLALRLPSELVLEALVDELDQLCEQRPIQTRRARTLIGCASVLPKPASSTAASRQLEEYARAVGTPSPLSELHPDRADYRDALVDATPDVIDAEISALANALRSTGLGSLYHALLLSHLTATDPTKLADALQLDDVGAASLYQNLDFVLEVIQLAIRPHTADAALGLIGVLERGLLSRPVIVRCLTRLMKIDMHASVTRKLLAQHEVDATLTAHALLLAGALGVLGQPLGIGQGQNPTCQSARALSLWSLHAPAHLLNLLIHAARDGCVQFDFEGRTLVSDKLMIGLMTKADPDLDTVSLVLVEHLDRVYGAMMTQAAGRGVDAHRWVNPAFYGRWVPSGFHCSVDEVSRQVVRFDAFVRAFYATYHPSFNDDEMPLYANPVGILVTDVHGRLLGPHAVSLLRVEPDTHGLLRAYFFNPNNEGRQDWGDGVVVTVSGNGEAPGESSLPFAQFVSRLYAFHDHPLEGGDPAAVPDRVVDEVMTASKATWGRSYVWAPTASVIAL